MSAVRIRFLHLVACASFVLAGCEESNSADRGQVASKTDELSTRIAQITKQLAKVEEQSKDAQQTARRVQFAFETERTRYQSAEFDPSEPAFQRIDSNTGSFAVSVDDVAQFGDGVRVRLNLGNLSSATYAGATLTLRYGPRAPPGTAEDFYSKYLEWDKALKSKEQTITADLRPGRWNPVPIILPSIDQKDFGYLEVKVATNQIKLY